MHHTQDRVARLHVVARPVSHVLPKRLFHRYCRVHTDGALRVAPFLPQNPERRSRHGVLDPETVCRASGKRSL